MKIQAKWFAMLGAAGAGALLLMSLFAGSALAQTRATPTPMTMQPANPNLRRGLPVITSTVTMTVMQGMSAMDHSMYYDSEMTATMPMTAMQRMPAAMPGAPMSQSMPMSMTMPAESGGMCKDGQCGMMQDMMAEMMGPDMMAEMQAMMGPDMMAKMHAMMAGGMMTSTMPMSMMQSGGMMMQPGMMGPDMMGRMHAMMAGGMMTSTMPMGMMQSGGMMMQPGMMGPDMMGRMQGGMMGPGMRDDSWGMPWMQPGAAQGQRLTGEQALKAATNALATRNNPDLQVAEMLEFDDAFYVRVAERSAGINAFELLVHPYTGVTRQEAGPSTIWNTKYGGSEGMAAIMRQGWAAPGSGQPTADMPIKADQALKNAQAYLDAQKNAQKVMQAAKFYGYYVVPTLSKDGKVAGLLAVNGYTGRVWDANRFGKLLATVAAKK
jgi:hypothetical protein